MRFSGAIREKAASLGGDPLALYNFVQGSVVPELYPGLRKGAAGALRTLTGNDVDQAALLIALLRTSGIPARFVSAEVRINADPLTSWLGAQGAEQALRLLFEAGIDARPRRSEDTLSAVELVHTMVAAYVPHAAYRGARIEADAGRRWVLLAPAFKQQASQPASPSLTSDEFDPEAFVTGYLSASQPFGPLATLRQSLGLGAPSPTPRIVAEDLEVLPPSPPFEVLSAAHEARTPPGCMRERISFVATSDLGERLIDFDVALADLAGRDVALQWEVAPGFEADVAAFGGLSLAPPYVAPTVAVLTVGGSVWERSEFALLRGRDVELSVVIQGPSGRRVVRNTIVWGATRAFGFLPRQAAVAASSVSSAAELLAGIAQDYLYQWDAADAHLAELTSVRRLPGPPALVQIFNRMESLHLAGVPHTFSWRGVDMDADLRRAQVVPGAAAPQSASAVSDFHLLSTLQGSYLEQRALEDALGAEAISTTKLLGLAAQQGLALIEIDAQNAGAILPTLPFAPSVLAAIEDAVERGETVHVPEAVVRVGDFEGIGFYAEQPGTGFRRYLLAGGLSGGIFPVSFGSVAQALVDLLVDSYRALTGSGDAPAFVYAAGGDQQRVVAGEQAPRPLIIQVLDDQRRPVAGTRVRFETTGAASIVGAQIRRTDAAGRVQLRVRAKSSTATQPVFIKLAASDAFPTRVGTAQIDAVLEGGARLIKPLELFVTPGPVAKLQITQPELRRTQHASPMARTPEALEVVALDAFDNPVANAQVSFAALPREPWTGGQHRGHPVPARDRCYDWRDSQTPGLVATSSEGALVRPPSSSSASVVVQSAHDGRARAHAWLGDVPLATYPFTATHRSHSERFEAHSSDVEAALLWLSPQEGTGSSCRPDWYDPAQPPPPALTAIVEQSGGGSASGDLIHVLRRSEESYDVGAYAVHTDMSLGGRTLVEHGCRSGVHSAYWSCLMNARLRLEPLPAYEVSLAVDGDAQAHLRQGESTLWAYQVEAGASTGPIRVAATVSPLASGLVYQDAPASSEPNALMAVDLRLGCIKPGVGFDAASKLGIVTDARERVVRDTQIAYRIDPATSYRASEASVVFYRGDQPVYVADGDALSGTGNVTVPSSTLLLRGEYQAALVINRLSGPPLEGPRIPVAVGPYRVRFEYDQAPTYNDYPAVVPGSECQSAHCAVVSAQSAHPQCRTGPSGEALEGTAQGRRLIDVSTRTPQPCIESRAAAAVPLKRSHFRVTVTDPSGEPVRDVAVRIVAKGDELRVDVSDSKTDLRGDVTGTLSHSGNSTPEGPTGIPLTVLVGEAAAEAAQQGLSFEQLDANVRQAVKHHVFTGHSLRYENEASLTCEVPLMPHSQVVIVHNLFEDQAYQPDISGQALVDRELASFPDDLSVLGLSDAQLQRLDPNGAQLQALLGPSLVELNGARIGGDLVEVQFEEPGAQGNPPHPNPSNLTGRIISGAAFAAEIALGMLTGGDFIEIAKEVFWKALYKGGEPNLLIVLASLVGLAMDGGYLLGALGAIGNAIVAVAKASLKFIPEPIQRWMMEEGLHAISTWVELIANYLGDKLGGVPEILAGLGNGRVAEAMGGLLTQVVRAQDAVERVMTRHIGEASAKRLGAEAAGEVQQFAVKHGLQLSDEAMEGATALVSKRAARDPGSPDPGAFRDPPDGAAKAAGELLDGLRHRITSRPEFQGLPDEAINDVLNRTLAAARHADFDLSDDALEGLARVANLGRTTPELADAAQKLLRDSSPVLESADGAVTICLENLRRFQGDEVVAFGRITDAVPARAVPDVPTSAADLDDLLLAMSNPRYGDAHGSIAGALDSFRRSDGDFVPGVLNPSTPDVTGSSALLRNLANGNRGHAYEVLGTKAILDRGSFAGRAITPDDIAGFGHRVSVRGTTSEADVLLTGGHAIDFKYRHSGQWVEEFGRIEQAANALEDGLFATFTYVTNGNFRLPVLDNVLTVAASRGLELRLRVDLAAVVVR